MMSTSPEFHNTQTAMRIHTGEEMGLPELKTHLMPFGPLLGGMQLLGTTTSPCLPYHSRLVEWLPPRRGLQGRVILSLAPREESSSVHVNKLSGRRQTTYLSTTLGWGNTNWMPYKYLSSGICERPLGEGK